LLIGYEIGPDKNIRNHTNQYKLPPTANPNFEMTDCGTTSPKMSTKVTDKMIAIYSGTIMSRKMGKDSIAAAFHY
jgi:hypothetical protein